MSSEARGRGSGVGGGLVGPAPAARPSIAPRHAPRPLHSSTPGRPRVYSGKSGKKWKKILCRRPKSDPEAALCWRASGITGWGGQLWGWGGGGEEGEESES